MRGEKLSIGLRAASAIITVALLVTSAWATPREKVLHSFNGRNGWAPYGLIFDAVGNLYGTTNSGGVFDQGTVFELTPKADGAWTEKILHNFKNDGKDGYVPSAGLIFDAAGNLYGTTLGGGSSTSCNYFGSVGCGTVFKLRPTADGVWTEDVLHSFSAADGSEPNGGLIFDLSGNLYGTTFYGGSGACVQQGVPVGCGTVFELTRKVGGGWTENVLHIFTGGSDGSWPQAGLILDAAGNLYGTTLVGGSSTSCTYFGVGCGTIFELRPMAGGGWEEKLLHIFHNNGRDGLNPRASLIFDAFGNLYGTTFEGGKVYHGTVFELKPKASGGWTEQVLHDFNGRDGLNPVGTLIFDAAGNLYGTTESSGAAGTVFELTPKAGGGWTEKVLHNFHGNGRDREGAIPDAGLIFDAVGNLYGTTASGGLYDMGTVFEITP